MLINKHMKELVDACYPATLDEAITLWHQIKPVRFGNRLTWIDLPTEQVLASYQIPEASPYLVILRVECYVFTDVAGAPGFRNFEPPPGGSLRWVANSTDSITPLVPAHLLVDIDELLIARGAETITLQGILSAPPDANPRFIRTTVYSYHISSQIADKIGSGEVLAFGRNT